MTWGSLILEPSLIAAVCAGAAVLGCVIWWLVRRRLERFWLPTLRVMELPPRVLPRLELRPPPWLSFLAFAAAALAVCAYTFKPRRQIFTPFEPHQTRIHVVVDMSPSVAAQLPLESYAEAIGRLVDTLLASGRVSITTSHSPRAMELSKGADARQMVQKLGYHRAGFKFGSAMKRLLEGPFEADRLFLVSDRDQHSWSGFNWRFLSDEMDVVFVDVATIDDKSPNVYVAEGRFMATPGAPTMEWDVELARRGALNAVSGKLIVSLGEERLGEFPWTLGEGKSRVTVRTSWASTLAEKAASKLAPGTPLSFKIEVPDDVLALDDVWRSELLGRRQDALLIADALGERPLEDPAKQLATSLEILGFRVKRHDTIKMPGPPVLGRPLWVILGGQGTGIDRYCPETPRILRQDASSTTTLSGAQLPKIWLAPASLEADWGELCRCYARLIKETGGQDPAYCEHVQSRSQWLGLLPSLGAKQIGGDIGESTNSLAFLGKDQKSGLEVLAFTLPLKPAVATGLTHAKLPILVKDLLTWQAVLEPRGMASAASWPRIDDIVASSWPELRASSFSTAAQGASSASENVSEAEREGAAKLLTSNVPMGESLLATVEPQNLPPRWTAQLEASGRMTPVKKDREDPVPWLMLVLMVAVGATAVEALVLAVMALVQWLGRKSRSGAVLLLVLLAGVAAAPRAEARIELNLIGYESASFQALAREVMQRTSLELAPSPLLFPRTEGEALGEPWLWVSDLSRISNREGQLSGDVLQWIGRGGFLIIETPTDEARLRTLAAPLGGDGFLPIPPDHELMRSFYLLDALPVCQNQIWRGLMHDGRLAIVAIPFGFTGVLKDHPAPAICTAGFEQERLVRVFVNLVMVALATDYKKDQIHLPEILKRLR